MFVSAVEILNTIEWTKQLNEMFKENLGNKRIQAWQYIGLSNGVFRTYPGKVNTD